jgi:hypothetical protein
MPQRVLDALLEKGMACKTGKGVKGEPVRYFVG